MCLDKQVLYCLVSEVTTKGQMRAVRGCQLKQREKPLSISILSDGNFRCFRQSTWYFSFWSNNEYLSKRNWIWSSCWNDINTDARRNLCSTWISQTIETIDCHSTELKQSCALWKMVRLKPFFFYFPQTHNLYEYGIKNLISSYFDRGKQI